MAKAATIHALYIRLRSTNGAWIASPKLRPCLVKDAKKKGTNLHDVAVGILAAAYRVPFEPSGRHTSPSPDAEELNLRVSGPLWRAISARAAGSRQQEALRALHEHYGLEMPARARAA